MARFDETKLYISFFERNLAGKSFSEIARVFKRDGVSKFVVGEAIDSLVESGKLKKVDGRFYVAGDKVSDVGEKIVGTFRANENGYGFVTCEDGREFFIHTEKMGQALNGDTVEIIPVPGGQKGDLAKVVNVIARGYTKIVGTKFSERGLTYVRPDDKAYFADIYISGGVRAEDGDKVFVDIERFPKNKCPEGRITCVLGRQYDFATEELALIYTKGVQTEFPSSVREAAKNVKTRVSPAELNGRVDLRDKLIFTIDGDSARDFDDAVSLDTVGGNYVLGVHIADVSHYVQEGDEIDECAYQRSTSVYLPDKVLPMLPFELSNGICSLNEGVTRLTVTVEITFDKSAEVKDVKIYESAIKSTYRLTYNKVQAMLDGDEKLIERYKSVYPTILKMDELRKKLEEKRLAAGYIDLDVKESEITIEGDEVTVGVHKSTQATRIIEQFMISANEAVASYLYYQGLPCVFRTHDKPDPDKIEKLKTFLAALGLNVNWRRDECYPTDFQRLLDGVSNKDCFAVVNKMVLRSMQKAKYSPVNVGHFGLASKCYCHFTSPIRRYPDLVVHRILKKALKGEIYELIDLYEGLTASVSENSSKKERAAEELERAVDDLYKVRYLSSKIGEEFFGIISGVTRSGFFVELEDTCEGFVPVQLLPAGKYEFDADKMILFTSKRKYKLGDKVKICVLSADVSSKRVDFCLAK